MEVLILQPGSLLLRLRDVDALVFHLKIRFGMQRYTFIEGFPPRSGEIFQADDRGDQRRDEEQPPEAGGFLEDQNAYEDGPYGADARPYRIGGPDWDRLARLGEKKHTEGCSNIRRLLAGRSQVGRCRSRWRRAVVSGTET